LTTFATATLRKLQLLPVFSCQRALRRQRQRPVIK